MASDLIFASVSAGHYFIIQNDVVVANIERVSTYNHRKTWPTVEYVVTWKDSEKEERHARLSDIHERHQFANYGGYMDVLRKKEYGKKNRSRWKKFSNASRETCSDPGRVGW